MGRLKWKEPITDSPGAPPLWRVGLVLWHSLGTLVWAAENLSVMLNREVTPETLRSQVLMYATPDDLPTKRHTRRQLRDWFVEFMASKDLSINEWLEFVAIKEEERCRVPSNEKQTE